MITLEAPDLRPWQRDVIDNMERMNCLVLHRRAGKTFLAILWLMKQVFDCSHPNPRGYYIASTYAQAKRIAWTYLKEFSLVIPGAKANESELRVDYPNGARIQLLGAEPSSIDHIRGVYCDALVMDETADLSSRLWTEVLRPTLADRHGSFVAIGTPKGRGNLFHKLYTDAQSREGWYRALMTYQDTGELSESEVEDMRRDMSEAAFAQELMVSFNASIEGAYYAQYLHDAESDGRITTVRHDPSLPVVTCWDLGISDSTAIWFLQVAGSEIRALEYVEFQAKGLPEIVRHLRERAYNYSQHILPHDVKVRELGTGKSRKEILENLGIPVDIAPKLSIEDGIQAVRSWLPRMVFDREGCELGIEALLHYRTEYDDIKQVFKNSPLHDWSSHCCDALRYGAITPLRSADWGSELDYSELNKQAGWR